MNFQLSAVNITTNLLRQAISTYYLVMSIKNRPFSIQENTRCSPYDRSDRSDQSLDYEVLFPKPETPSACLSLQGVVSRGVRLVPAEMHVGSL